MALGVGEGGGLGGWGGVGGPGGGKDLRGGGGSVGRGQKPRAGLSEGTRPQERKHAKGGRGSEFRNHGQRWAENVGGTPTTLGGVPL